jgi:hypothetical protein
MTSAPAASTALTSSARRLKSADRIEGAIFFIYYLHPQIDSNEQNVILINKNVFKQNFILLGQ